MHYSELINGQISISLALKVVLQAKLDDLDLLLCQRVASFVSSTSASYARIINKLYTAEC